MSILRTYNLQNPDSAGNNIELTQNGGAIVSGISTFVSSLTAQSGIRVSSGSSIGIGTDNPNSLLHVVDGDIKITNNISGITTGIFRRTITNNYGWTGSAENSDIPVGTYGISIDNTDRTTHNTVALAKFTTFKNATGDNPGIVYIGAVDSGEGTNHSSDFIVALKDGSPTVVERLRVNHDGEVQIVNGNLKFSTAGTGIDFSATADGTGAVSEILQDYEEGEWTPEIVGSTSGTAVASTGAGSGGWYVRVGNTVWLNFYFANPTITGTMSGSLRLNLPFTSANNDRFDNGGGGNLTYTRNLKSGDDHRRITLNVDRNTSYAQFKTLYDNSTSETADLTQTMAALVSSTLIKGNIIMRVD